MKHITIGMLAHVDAGKTTLSEAFLLQSGAIRKAGRVDDGDTHFDTSSVEVERGITVFSSQGEFTYGDMSVTLMDTPGHVDFSAEMERILPILDYAIVIISGPEGVMGHTKTVWRLLEKAGIPTFIFINKMDRPGTDVEKILSQLRAELNPNVINICDETAAQEEIAMCDNALMDEFLDKGKVSDSVVAEAIRDRKLFLCYFGSALRYEGVSEFLNVIDRFTIENKYGSDFGAKVFKITRDPKNERLVFVKVTGGQLRTKQIIRTNNEAGTEEKIDSIRIYTGDRYENVDCVEAGRVCALCGIKTAQINDTFGVETSQYIPELTPVISYTVNILGNVNANDAFEKLSIIGEESPELNICWDENNALSIKVMGQIQTEIFKRLAKERFGIDVEFTSERIVYKETICDSVIGVGHFEPLRHYAEVHLRIEPAKRGSGLILETDCSQDILATNWQRLVLTHLSERRHRGVLTGAELTDVKITLICGRAHIKHTEGGDFRQATYRAVRQGLMQAQSVLLEPIYSFVLDVPLENVGRAMSDLSNMSATFTQPQIKGNTATIEGTAPVVVMSSYAMEVAAYTKGAGSLSYAPAGYDRCHNEAEVIANKAYDPCADIRNTPDSVFCAHGSGFVVPWNEVFFHMHLPLDGIEEEHPVSMMERIDIALGVEEIDEIIRKLGGSNKKSDKTVREYSNTPVKETVYKAKPQKDKYYLVDGYNVIFAWKELTELAQKNVEAARTRLADVMCGYAAIIGVELIVVFDAYRVAEHPTEIKDYNNIHIVYTKESQTADSYIEQFAHTNASRYDITVVTSDGLEQIIIRGEGCGLISSREFEQIVVDAQKKIMKEYVDKRNNEDRVYLGDFLPKDLTN